MYSRDSCHHYPNPIPIPLWSAMINAVAMVSCDKHPHNEVSKTCRICPTPYCHECQAPHFGICENCADKILIGLFIVMVITSYVAWFGIL